jgi:rubredoxin
MEVFMVWVCTVCGYRYEEEVEKVPFAELPDDWACPICGAPKSAFEKSAT